MQYVETLHPLVAADNIGCRIALRMTRMKTYTGRIREHIQSIELRLGKIIDIRLECLVVFPEFLPFLFDRLIIKYAHLDLHKIKR